MTGSASSDGPSAGPPPRDVLGAATPGEAEALPAGAHLDRYVLLGRVGAGGMGVVYAAYDTKLDRKVALKVLRDQGDERRRGRLLREAQALARLQHPNVVAAYDVVSEGELLLLAMEFVEGEALRTWLETARPVHEVLAMFVAAGRGLAAAHEAGVVHRDFKPDNVLVGKDGRPRVADFGLALARDDEAPASVARPFASGGRGSVAGTPAYMSPEQKRGERVDARSDQYNFCVALYEALYGELPGRPGESGRRRPPARGRAPARVAMAVARGLSAEPAGRYPDMGALLADLAYDPGSARRRALGAASLVALSGLAWASAWWGRDRAPPCHNAEALLAGAWDDARRQALRAAFLATGKPYAEAALAETTRALDDYARRWAGLRTEVCEATLVRREQSQELFELRNACLDGRRQTLAAYADELSRADDKAVQLAPLNARSLPDLARCSDVAGLQALVPPPNDEAARRRIEGVRERLARIEALRIAGKNSGARAQLEAANAEADAIGYAPLVAEARLQLGVLDDYPKDPQRAADALTSAIWQAEAGRHAEVLVKAWAKLAWAQALRSNFEEAKASARHAESLLEGMGRPAPLDAAMSVDLGACYSHFEEQASAERHLLRALEIRERLLGPDAVNLAPVHNNLATTYHRMGRIDQALGHAQRALAILERALGPSHPRVCIVLVNLLGELSEGGRIEEGLALGDRAIAACDSAYGAESTAALTAVMNVGLLDYAVGQNDRALGLTRRAADGLSRTAGPRSIDFAVALLSLSGALSAHGEHRDAVATAERALAIERELLAPGNATLRYPYTALAEALLSAGRARDALAPAERAMALAEASLGARNPQAVFARTFFALAQLSAGRAESARATLGPIAGPSDDAATLPNPLDAAGLRLAVAYAEEGPPHADLLARARDDFARQGRAGRQRLAQIEGWLGRR